MEKQVQAAEKLGFKEAERELGHEVANCRRNVQALKLVLERQGETYAELAESTLLRLSRAEELIEQVRRLYWAVMNERNIYHDLVAVAAGIADVEDEEAAECRVCGGKGWVEVLAVQMDGSMNVQRCDTCKRYASDAQAQAQKK